MLLFPNLYFTCERVYLTIGLLMVLWSKWPNSMFNTITFVKPINKYLNDLIWFRWASSFNSAARNVFDTVLQKHGQCYWIIFHFLFMNYAHATIYTEHFHYAQLVHNKHITSDVPPHKPLSQWTQLRGTVMPRLRCVH